MTATSITHVVSGEVVPTENNLHDAQGGWAIRNTLASPDAASLQASIERTELLERSNTLALGIDAAESANCKNSLEKMLCHQMALAHQTAFKVIDKAMQQNNPAEMTRLLNASSRMMSTFQQAILVLNRIRTGGTQTVTVQHINIEGGQTLVAGKVQTRGKQQSSRGGEMKSENQPLALASALRCGAKTRSGRHCQAPAIKGKKRCRMHGGNNPGAPKGNQNALKSGWHTREMIALKREAASISKELKELLSSIT